MKKKRRLQADAIWAAGAALLILLQFWWLPGSPGSTVDSFSTGIDGKLGLFRALDRLFPQVEREKERPIPDSNCTLLIIGPDRLPTAAEQTRLAAFVNGGGTLLFAPSFTEPSVDLAELRINLTELKPLETFGAPTPNSSAVPVTAPPQAISSAPASADPEDPDPSAEDDSSSPTTPTVPANPATPVVPTTPSVQPGTESADLPLAGTREVLCESPYSSGTAELTVGSRFTWLPSDSEVLAESGNAAMAASWEQGAGRVIVCTTPDFFSNRSLLMPASSRLAVRLAAWGILQPSTYQEEGWAYFDKSRIVISEYFNTTDSMLGAGVLFSSGLRIGTLQLILAAALALWLGFHRFGPAEQDLRLQRRSLTETARAVGNLQYRSSDGGALVSARLDYLRGQLRRRYGSAVSLQNRASLTRLSGLTAEEVSSRLNLAERQSDHPRLPVSDAAVTIRWLSQLQQAVLGSLPGRNGRGKRPAS